MLAEDRNTDNIALAYKQHYANLKFHRGYDDPGRTGEEDYKVEREHKYSWKLGTGPFISLFVSTLLTYFITSISVT